MPRTLSNTRDSVSEQLLNVPLTYLFTAPGPTRGGTGVEGEHMECCGMPSLVCQARTSTTRSSRWFSCLQSVLSVLSNCCVLSS